MKFMRSDILRSRAAFLLVVAVFGTGACAPRLKTLPGTAFTGPVPATRLTGYQRIVFNWEYLDQSMKFSGEGSVRVAGPDSARVDIFIGSAPAMYAVLIGDGPLRSPFGDAIIKILPDAPMMWALLGRLAIPAGDTLKTIQEAILRVQVGSEPIYRASFDGTRLARVEYASKGRIRQTVTRAPDGSVTYMDERGNRRLRMTNVRLFNETGFDPTIWRN